MKKILFSLGALGLAVALVPMFAAFEAHVINVTATIENALSVNTEPITFGTVFPQEHLEKPLKIELSRSFLAEPRVDDVEYFIRQKPKCGVTTVDGMTLIGPTWTGHVMVDPVTGKPVIDCEKDKPVLPNPLPIGQMYGMLPSLCEYISKDGEKRDPDLTGGIDGVTPSFHKPWTVVGGVLTWHDTKGRLAKSANDLMDEWVIDLAVPCFGGHCAQDWADFVHKHSPLANPDEYDQDMANEHKVFGCNLWVEVEEVSERPIVVPPPPPLTE